MKLENIGFYTLTDDRASSSTKDSRLMRCELILTDLCNFKCPYCNGLREDCKGTMSLQRAKEIVDYWAKDNLKSIRLSGGEPTVYKDIVELVAYIKSKGVENIAISTNGYASMDLYNKLVAAGVNDFSISLDACCSAFGDKMTGGIEGAWDKVVSNIKEIAKIAYVTLGVVVTDETIGSLKETIEFCATLGVADIRIISAAQWDELLVNAKDVDESVYQKYPILKYRIQNICKGRNVRGISETDSRRCNLVLDDMAIAGDYHFPCIIYMREHGDAIGRVSDCIREERFQWSRTHNCYTDPICKKNCLDVCIDYNNKHNYFQIKNQTIVPKLDSTRFTFETWEAGSVHDFMIDHFRFDNLKEHKEKLRHNLIGYCFGEELMCRPKESEVALMYEFGDRVFWFHVRNSEFIELFLRD